MSDAPQMLFHYFRAGRGVVARYGTDAFIGATRGPKGFVVNPDAVVAIPETELRVHRKSYASDVRLGALKRATAAEYQAYQDRRRTKAAPAAQPE